MARKCSTILVWMILIASTVAVRDVPAAGFYGSPEEVHPILVGTEAPDGDLTTIDGSRTSLSAALGGQPGVVVFYRGNW